MQGWRSLRSGSRRYVAGPGGTEMLYDLNNDPYEYNNVAAQEAYRDAFTEMRGLLIKRMLRIDSCMERNYVY
jgi:hypothetical protein